MLKITKLIFAIVAALYPGFSYSRIPNRDYSSEVREFLTDVRHVIISKSKNRISPNWSKLLNQFDKNINAPMYRNDKNYIGWMIAVSKRNNTKINKNELLYEDQFYFNISTSHGKICIDGRADGVDILKNSFSVSYYMIAPKYIVKAGRCASEI